MSRIVFLGVLIKISFIVHLKEHQEILMYVMSGFIAALNEVGLSSVKDCLALMGIEMPRLSYLLFSGEE